MSSSKLAETAQAAGSSTIRDSTRYEAPYHQQESPYQDHYMVTFKEDHTLAAHFAFLGEKFDIAGTLDEGYYAKFDRKLFERVRRDPGVELVEDDTLELLEQLHREGDVQKAESVPTPYQASYNRLSGYPYHDHYTVELKPSHTLAKHFAFVGREFDVEVASETLYLAKLDSELFEAVRKDPGVELVEDDPLEGLDGGSFGPTEEELEESRLKDEEEERVARE